MLQNIHEKAKGWIAAVILGFISLTFAFWGVSNYFGHGKTDTVVAKVNGSKVTEKQLNTAYKRFQRKQQMLGLHLANTPEVEKAVKQEILQGIIQNQVMVQGAKDVNFYVSQQQVDRTLMGISYLQVNGQFSRQRFIALLSNLMQTQQQFMQQLHDQLLLGQLRDSFFKTAFALPSEVTQMVKLVDQKRDIRYAELDKIEIKQTPKVSQQAIDNYYEQHKEQYKVPAKVKLAYIALNIDNLAKHMHPTAAAVKQYYVANKNMFANKSESQVTSQIKSILAKTMAQKTFASQQDQLANLVYENPSSLKEAAKILNLTIKNTDYITQGAKGSGIAADKNVMAQAFSNDVFNQGYNSGVISLQDGQQVVIRVLDKKPASYKPLKEVKSQIILQLKDDSIRQALQNKAQKIVAAIKAGTPLDKLNQQYHLNWQEKHNIGRNSHSSQALIQAAFKLRLPTKTNHAASVAAVALENGNYAVLMATKIIPGALESLSQQEKENLKQQIIGSYGRYDFELFTQELLNQAKVKHYLKS